MRIEQLYYFTEAVRAKSISAAAEKIFITQQTISQAINHLEKELGVQLLVRTPKGVELTHSGDIFYRKASQVLTDYGQLKTCFSEADGVDRAEDEALRLYSSKVINDAVLGDIVGNFYNIFPHMQLALTEKNSQDIIPLLVAEPESLGIITMISEYFAQFVVGKYGQALQWEILYTEPLLVAVSYRSPLAKRVSLSLREVLAQPLAQEVIYGATGESLLKLLGDETVAPLQIVLNTDNGQMLKQAVEDNHVLTFCTALSVTYGQSTLDLQKVRLIPLKEKLQISYLVVRSNQHVNKYIENLLIQKMRDFFGYWMRQTKGE